MNVKDKAREQELLNKWKPILEVEDAPKIINKKIRNATAMMLENQVK
jgi:hypothetical protein